MKRIIVIFLVFVTGLLVGTFVGASPACKVTLAYFWRHDFGIEQQGGMATPICGGGAVYADPGGCGRAYGKWDECRNICSCTEGFYWDGEFCQRLK